MPRRQLRLLDLFCGAGGAGYGYKLAGFHVTGVDHEDFRNYAGDEFVRGDALTFLLENHRRFDCVHASPPCQRYSVISHVHASQRKHPDHIYRTRWLLNDLRIPYVIENVIGAPLLFPVTLCGSHFGLGVRRHRLFECSFSVPQPTCKCKGMSPVMVAGHSGGSSTRDAKKFNTTQNWKRAMGIYWMTGQQLAQSIPPRYTRYVGKYLLKHVHLNT